MVSVSPVSMPSLIEATELLLSARAVYIFSHTNPDADAYGSSCGLAASLRQLGAEVRVFNEHGSVPRYGAIPGVAAVEAAIPLSIPEGVVVVVCDCGALERVGDGVVAALRETQPHLNIDHHTSNTQFGRVNMVVEGASSTSEVVFNLVRSIEERSGRTDLFTQPAAAALMAGIIGDTGSFRYASTTARTFLVAHALMERGARPDILSQRLFATVSLAAMRLQGEAIGALELHCAGRFAEVCVTQEMLQRHGASILDADSLAERARDIEGVCVSALFKQDQELWRVSLRSRAGDGVGVAGDSVAGVDVSKIAQLFGGGGHKPAAAFRWRGEISVVRDMVRRAVAAALEEQISRGVRDA